VTKKRYHSTGVMIRRELSLAAAVSPKVRNRGNSGHNVQAGGTVVQEALEKEWGEEKASEKGTADKRAEETEGKEEEEENEQEEAEDEGDESSVQESSDWDDTDDDADDDLVVGEVASFLRSLRAEFPTGTRRRSKHSQFSSVEGEEVDLGMIARCVHHQFEVGPEGQLVLLNAPKEGEETSPTTRDVTHEGAFVIEEEERGDQEASMNGECEKLERLRMRTRKHRRMVPKTVRVNSFSSVLAGLSEKDARAVALLMASS